MLIKAFIKAFKDIQVRHEDGACPNLNRMALRGSPPPICPITLCDLYVFFSNCQLSLYDIWEEDTLRGVSLAYSWLFLLDV